MAVPTNRWKLGLFVLVGIGAIIAVAVAFGAQSMRKETLTYYTYFNESVQGLEVGSPVKYRGVTVGHVAAIEIAPDRRHVEVAHEIDVADIRRMGLVEQGNGKKKAHFSVPPDLRAQLGSQGITGVKFIAMDFFDPKSSPPPALPFPPRDNYIPAAVSMMKNLEDTISKAMDRLPELVDAIVAIMGRVDRMVAVLERENVTEKFATTMTHADEVMSSLQLTLKKIDRADLPGRAASTIDDIRVAAAKMNSVLDRVDGEGGFIATAQNAAAAFGEVGRSANGTTRDLDETMREVREAADAIRVLADALERDPDMLLKGRAKGKLR